MERHAGTLSTKWCHLALLLPVEALGAIRVAACCRAKGGVPYTLCTLVEDEM